ncbi:MAG: hypothetical protein WHV67_09365 [Thermoanaerobaculia bacterium]
MIGLLNLRKLKLLFFLIFLVGYTGKGTLLASNPSIFFNKNLNPREKKLSNFNPCDLISKELIEEAIGRKIVKVEKVELKTIRYCSYYTVYIDPQSGGANVAIGFGKEDYEKLKKELEEKWDNRFIKDSRISVNHYLIKQGETIWEIDLFLNENEYLGIKSNHGAVSSEELIKIALKILEKKPELFYKEKKKVPLPRDEDIIYNFANLIEEKRYYEAASMIKTESEGELNAWATQFSFIRKFQVLKIEEYKKEEWTKNKHYFKVIFDVLMEPESKNAPIPYYGWENGENTRWITLEKIGNISRISEISTGP